MTINVLSQHAEDVSGFVWLAVAAYNKSEQASRNLEDWREASNSNRSILAAISEIVSHVEVYVVESLTAHARLVSSPAAEPIPTIVMSAITKPVDSNWAERRKFIKTWMGIEVADAGWWRRWLGFVEGRNAWAHGLGRLTARQCNNQEVAANLAAAGLTVQSSAVIGTSADVKRCAKAAIEVINWIDSRVVRN